MAFVTTKEMFKKAYEGGYAVGAFNVNNMEIIQGITEAAIENRAPLVLQVSKGARAYAKHVYLMKLIEAAIQDAEQSAGFDLPVCVHLDHGESIEYIARAFRLGFTSAMYDGSLLPFDENVANDWMELRQRMMTLLQEEAELEEIVKMVGMDALSPTDRLKMEAARSIREDFLHQNSFHEVDTYTSLKKQHMMMRLVNAFYERSVAALGEGASLRKLISMPVREQIGRFKYVKEDALDAEFVKVDEELSAQIANAFVKEDR